MDLLSFKSSLAHALIYSNASVGDKKRGRPTEGPSLAAVKRRVLERACVELIRDGGPHYPARTDKDYASKCHLFGCPRKTRYYCTRCREPLCPECFEEFHTR